MAHSPLPRNGADLRVVAIALLAIVGIAGLSLWRTVLRPPGEETLERAAQENALPLVSVSAVQEKMRRREALQFVDIRSPQAYQDSHIPGSLSLPGGTLQSYSPTDNRFTLIVFSTDDPGSSQTAQAILKSTAFPYAFIQGGFEAWAGAGGETISIGDPNNFADQSKIDYISPKEAATLLETPPPNLFILDVQTAQHFQEKHLRGAVNIPLAELETRAGEIPPAKSILVYGENELASFQGGVRLFDLHFYGAQTLSGNELLEKTVPLPVESSIQPAQ
ncbi:MAG: rhodanese-like domain-containing protein [Candidatus Moraniibacteriota bacterium]